MLYALCRIFVESQVKRIKKVRERYNMEGRSLLTVEKHLERITVGQLVEFCEFSKEKYQRAKIEPGIKLLTIVTLDNSNLRLLSKVPQLEPSARKVLENRALR